MSTTRSNARWYFSPLVVLLCAFGASYGGGPRARDEAILRECGVQATPGGLIGFFRRQVELTKDPRICARLIEQLGSDSYEVRRAAARALQLGGRPVVSHLRRALNNPDAEIVRSARRCLQRIERGPGPLLPEAAARFLARHKSAPAAEALVAYLPIAEDEVVRAEVLRSLTIIGASVGKPATARVHSAWDQWWHAHLKNIRLARATPIVLGPVRILVADLDDGYVLGYNSAFTERWSISDLRGPIDFQRLPNGNILIAENHSQRVTERSPAGAIVWSKAIASYPLGCRRCRDGTTCIVTEEKLLICNAVGKDLRSLNWPVPIYCARWLDDEKMVLLTTSGKVIVFTIAGKEVRSWDSQEKVDKWSTLTLLPNGHVLVAGCDFGNKVVEFDRTGEVVWQCRVPGAICAARLPNGHTIIGEKLGSRLVEVDRSGVPVYEVRMEGRPWRVRVMP